MQYLYQKISYLKGITDGLKVNNDTDEGRLFLNIIDALEEIVETLDAIVDVQEDMEDYISLIDLDLSDVEEELYGIEFDDDYGECIIDEFDAEDFDQNLEEDMEEKED